MDESNDGRSGASARRVIVHGEDRGVSASAFNTSEAREHCVDEEHPTDLDKARESVHERLCWDILRHQSFDVFSEA